MATDGHRLAQAELPLPAGAAGMPGIILPRKTVHELHRLIEDSQATVSVGVSTAKVRFEIGTITLTSKLIDGTFPDYARVIPKGNDKVLKVSNAEFKSAVDRVSTIASERGRAVKLNINRDKLVLSVNNPEGGSATEEIGVDYEAAPLEIGFNARYLLDIAGQLESDDGAVPAGRSGLADHGQGRQRRRRALRAHADARLMHDGALPARWPMSDMLTPAEQAVRPARPRPASWVERLHLTDFRNYAGLSLERRAAARRACGRQRLRQDQSARGAVAARVRPGLAPRALPGAGQASAQRAGRLPRTCARSTAASTSAPAARPARRPAGAAAASCASTARTSRAPARSPTTSRWSG